MKKNNILLVFIFVTFQFTYSAEESINEYKSLKDLTPKEIRMGYEESEGKCFVCNVFVKKDNWIRHLRKVHIESTKGRRICFALSNKEETKEEEETAVRKRDLWIYTGDEMY